MDAAGGKKASGKTCSSSNGSGSSSSSSSSRSRSSSRTSRHSTLRPQQG